MEQVDRGTSLLLPSAKLTAVETKVRQWLMEAPDEKIIIFTQFKQGAAMIGRSLEKMKTEFIYYTVSIHIRNLRLNF
jgi:ERCC4-related helicase